MKNSPEVQAAADQRRKLTNPKMSVRITKQLKEDVLFITESQGISFNALVTALLEEYVRTH